MKRLRTSGAGARGAAGVVAALLLASGDARASKRHTAEVVVVEGPGARAVEGWIEDSLNGPDTIEQEEAFRGALRAHGVLPLRRAAGDAARDTRLIACVHAAAGQADVDGAFLVDVDKTSNATHVHLWRIDARPGGAVVEHDLTLPLSTTSAETSRAILAMATPASTPAVVAPVAALPPPPAPQPPAQAPAPKPRLTSVSLAPGAPEADRAASSGAKSDGAHLSMQAALGVGTRHFTYVDRVTPTLRPYDLGAAPMASMRAAVYPLSATRTPVLRDLGVTGEYAQAFAFSSQDSSGAHVGATWRSFEVGATERIPIATSLRGNVSVTYGGNDFQFDHSLASSAASLPSVAYRFVRMGADLHFALPPLPDFVISGGGSYLDLLDTGYTNQLFPRQSAGGVEAHLGVSYRIAKRFELSLEASYLRVFYSFNPVPGDTNVAGGALDEQGRALAGLSYVM